MAAWRVGGAAPRSDYGGGVAPRWVGVLGLAGGVGIVGGLVPGRRVASADLLGTGRGGPGGRGDPASRSPRVTSENFVVWTSTSCTLGHRQSVRDFWARFAA